MARKIMIITTDDEIVEIDEACPHCGERRTEHLANHDGIVTCGSCHRTYDLEPERREEKNA
jgi:ribosomal protein S27AE